MFTRLIRTVPLVLVAALASNFSVAAATGYKVLAYLTPQTQGPIGIVEGPANTFFTLAGPGIASVNVQGTVQIVASFPEQQGNVESGPGATAANGRLYSSYERSASGGSGNAFSVTSRPGSQINYAAGKLVPALSGNLPDGTLFGTSYSYSTLSYALATVSLEGAITPFYQFPSSDQPYHVFYGSDGNFYGTALSHNNSAYVFQATPGGSLKTIGAIPVIISWVGGGVLIEGSDGNFYGIQETGLGCGAQNQHGAVYQLTPSGQYTVLHDFGICGNAIVNSLIEGSDGNLYGAIQGNSQIFRLSKTGEYQVVFAVTNGITQGACTCTLVEGGDGVIYGTMEYGGPKNYGVIFALDLGLPIPKPSAAAFFPASGSAGTQVRIWGHNLLGSAVEFNGVAAAAVSGAGPNYVWATVPAGAATGPISVTTPGGTTMTANNFTVE